MTRFLDKLTIATLGRQPIDEPLYRIKFTESPPTAEHRYAREYRITVELGSVVLLDEDLIKQSDGEVIKWAVDDMRKSIARVLYDEIEHKLIDVYYDLKRESYGQPSEHVKKIESILELIRV